MDEYLFSYGTLQLESVQIATFGRTLAGTADALPGFQQSTIEIDDPAVVEMSGKAQHLIIAFTGRESDVVHGVVFRITADELRHADEYETSDYKRIAVTLRSGQQAWVYVDGRHAPPADPHDLNRFVQVQEHDYDRVLAELRSGRKRTHWMWYIFPQFDGLGSSPAAVHYAIKSIDEARAYLGHSVLGSRLLECAEAIVAVDGRSATEILGTPDDLKLRSCATLFAGVSPPGSVFERVLAKYYQGQRDSLTLDALRRR